MVLSFTACGTKAEATWQEQYDLGMKYVSEAKYEEAILAFTKAIEIDSKQVDAYIALADVYISQGETDKAVDVINQGRDAVDDDSRFDEKIESLKPEPELTVKQLDREDGSYIISKFNEDGLIVDWAVYNANDSLNEHWIYTYDEIAMTVMYYDENDDLTGYSVNEYGEPGKYVASGVIARSYEYDTNGVLISLEEYINGNAGGVHTEYNADGSIKDTWNIVYRTSN